MKSHQINFFMTPEDAVELQQYINLQGLVVVATSNTVCEPKIIETFTNIKDLKIYFTLPKFLKDIKMNYFENRDEYVVDDMSAAFIEYRKSYFSEAEKILRTGRIYFSQYQYNADKELILKDEKIITLANDLFKWFKKHFKDTKINTWHTTKRALEMANKMNIQLSTTY